MSGHGLSDEVKNLAKMSWRHGVVSMVLFAIGLNMKMFGLRGLPVG